MGGSGGGTGGLLDASAYYETISANSRSKREAKTAKRQQKIEKSALAQNQSQFIASLRQAEQQISGNQVATAKSLALAEEQQRSTNELIKEYLPWIFGLVVVVIGYFIVKNKG